MLWTGYLFWTRLMCTSLFVLPLVPVSIAVLGQPSWYTLSVVDQISDQIQVQTMSWMPIGARVSEQLLDQYPRPIIDTRNTVDNIESAHESEGNDGHGGNTFLKSDCLSFEYQPSMSPIDKPTRRTRGPIWQRHDSFWRWIWNRDIVSYSPPPQALAWT